MPQTFALALPGIALLAPLVGGSAPSNGASPSSLATDAAVPEVDFFTQPDGAPSRVTSSQGLCDYGGP